MLNVVLASDRVTFRPVEAGGWEATVPIAFDQVLRAALPAVEELQDKVASPAGFEPALPA